MTRSCFQLEPEHDGSNRDGGRVFGGQFQATGSNGRNRFKRLINRRNHRRSISTFPGELLGGVDDQIIVARVARWRVVQKFIDGARDLRLVWH